MARNGGNRLRSDAGSYRRTESLDPILCM